MLGAGSLEGQGRGGGHREPTIRSWEQEKTGLPQWPWQQTGTCSLWRALWCFCMGKMCRLANMQLFNISGTASSMMAGAVSALFPGVPWSKRRAWFILFSSYPSSRTLMSLVTRFHRLPHPCGPRCRAGPGEGWARVPSALTLAAPLSC